ncbi:MAG: NAD(P)-dependent oxidoreductase [Calditrichaeota bacterium]|nr:MAG: NAD(P)-dependent oxidoreductase [Calditrichota bacterium]
MSRTIAFLGTGLMGYPMVEKLLEAGYAVIAWNRTREKALPLREKGARVADSAAEAIAAAEVTLLMLTDYPAIQEVLFPGGNLLEVRGKTVIQMGTILPEESRRLQQAITEAGGDYLEAPVLGSIPQVREKQLIVMVGGTGEQFRRWTEVFRAFGSEVHHVGEVGQAAATKLALNHLIAAEAAAFSLSLGLVQGHGVEVELFMNILRHSALYAPTFDKKLPRMLSRDFENPNFPAKHMLKDVNLILAAAQEAGLSTEMLEGVRSLLETAVHSGHADHDYAAIYEAVVPPRK